MPHWSKDPEKKRLTLEKIRKKLQSNPEMLSRRGKIAAAAREHAWNKGLPKERQPRFGKPVSQKQIDNMREIGKRSHPTWNKGLCEHSPRLREETIRQEALQRDGRQCKECRSKDNLVIHHIKHWEEVRDWRYIHSLENLVTLCNSCHIRRHNMQKLELRKEEDLQCQE